MFSLHSNTLGSQKSSPSPAKCNSGCDHVGHQEKILIQRWGNEVYSQLSSCSLAMLEMSGRSILKPISVFYASFVAASVYLIGCSVSSRTLLTNDSSIDLLGCSVGETRFCVTSRSLENPAYSSPRPGAERQGKSEKLLPVSPRVPTVAQES